MKIAMLGQKEVPSRAGGIEVAVEELAVRMVARGHEVTLYNCCRQGMRRAGKREKNKTYKGVQICEIFVPNIRGVAAALGSVIATIRAVSKKIRLYSFSRRRVCSTIFSSAFFWNPDGSNNSWFGLAAEQMGEFCCLLSETGGKSCSFFRR